jgi:hypothetical protein
MYSTRQYLFSRSISAMAPSLILLTLATVLTSPLGYVRAACEPEIPFPPPQYSDGLLQDAFSEINSSINAAIASGVFNSTSFSLEISSSQATMYSLYHTAKTTQGTTRVDGSSVYRIASNSKLFTALGILKEEAAGNLSLDDCITKYIPGLQTNGSKVSWNKITIRTLLAHQGGLPDNCRNLPSFPSTFLLLAVPFSYGQSSDEAYQTPKTICYSPFQIQLRLDCPLSARLRPVNCRNARPFPITHLLAPRQVRLLFLPPEPRVA